MGGKTSKKPFTEWNLIEYSNMTNIPLKTVEDIYKEFMTLTNNKNKMDKKEFRRLYKQMYLNNQHGNKVAPFFSDQDLDKMSDHIFEIYDIEGAGELTFEDFAEIYLMLNHYYSSSNGVTGRQRFNYILDQYDTAPGIVTPEQSQQVFNYLNKYNNLPYFNNQANNNLAKSNLNDWEFHWNKLNDGTGRVPKEKFIDYVTKLNEYKHHFDPSTRTI